jgi:hypothetical protein
VAVVTPAGGPPGELGRCHLDVGIVYQVISGGLE